MQIEIESSFSFTAEASTDMLLQFEAAAIPEQQILSCETRMDPAEHIARVAAQDNIGERIWLRCQGEFNVHYSARIGLQRMQAGLDDLGRLDPHNLPAETVQYLFDSRYCAATRFQSFVEAEFGGKTGGRRVLAMRDWITRKIRYQPGTSDSNTTALDSFVERRGICRDYAHLMVSFARASEIPARYVSVYAPEVDPADFHAVAEVFLQDPDIPGGGAWYIVDATRMAGPDDAVKIGVGRDAADVSFMTVFGPTQFGNQQVSVRRRG
ncbi:Transglutaminase-like superfamily protein [Croceibacterium atlanticum]|uniref:Transglutaminase-like superfamily protein n=2 Tax=Croceibacterium atlanticum TaxID=1267766 RepID=A0A0F7KSJ3_9SPHN|nr:transglutaminase family protein [Croceibacterium atlanticum]AKH42554.1 Transglutaminase-like superfamily protein [Croceibacterium atlanticum]